MKFEDQTDSSREWIAKLWATRRVGYLLDQIRLHGESAELKDEIVTLARRWGVVTPYTAMLIIEDERRRNVPVAQRSMREMEFDNRAASNSAAGMDSLRSRDATGSQAVANSINTSGYKMAQNLQSAGEVAQQSSSHANFADQSGAALAKGPDAPSAAPAGSQSGRRLAGGAAVDAAAVAVVERGRRWRRRGGRWRGAGGGGGGEARGRGAAARRCAGSAPAYDPATPSINKDELNLGTQTTSGWQAGDATKDLGYRTITNYAQQTRVINNRSFFLNGNQWTDSQVQQMKSPAHVHVVFNSDAYFALIAKYPDAAQYLSLGNNITLELGGTVYDIVEEQAPTPK